MRKAKKISLEEARRKGLLDQFAREHPNETDAERFQRLLKAMASGKKPKGAETSNGAASED